MITKLVLEVIEVGCGVHGSTYIALLDKENDHVVKIYCPLEPSREVGAMLYQDVDVSIQVDPIPDFGVEGIRDKNNPCEMFRPGNPAGSPHDCTGDGHYLCSECRVRVANLNDCYAPDGIEELEND